MSVTRPARWSWAGCAVVVLLAAAPVGGQHHAIETVEIHLPGADGTDEVVWIGWPAGVEGPLPVLVALHGAGEARRGRGRGHLGWSRDYHLGDAFEALLGGRLSRADYGELVTDAHLSRRNRALRRRPFAGLVVVTPYTPNLLSEPVGAAAILAYGDWIAGPLLDAVRRAVPVASPDRAGIDGVSLGGRMALEVGLRHPERFQSVGAIQPAVRGHASEVAALARAGTALRLLSSEEDPFLAATRAVAGDWEAAGIAHELLVLPGPHDYAFNRGPGSVELLFFHERALANGGS